MASSASAAIALAGAHDLRLRPRLLRALLDSCLPLPDDLGPPPRPTDLAYAADAVRAHGLLAEHAADDAGIREEWRAAVDAWVDRLLDLVDSDKEHNCWVGTSFLGLAIQECCDERFVKSYSDWFQKVLRKMKEPSCIKMVNIFTCVTMSDLLVRLSTFPNLKDEATSFAKKVVKPSLRLLDEDENGPFTEKAIDLLGLLMKLYPSSVYRHFNNVESIITEKIMCGKYNLQQSKKLASTLALLPCVRISQNSMSLMIQKLLIVVNTMLNDTFLGLEEGHTDQELLLAPPGSKLVPSFEDQKINGDRHIHSTKKFRAYVVPTISALVHCCSVMLTSSYPIQVTDIPVNALVTLIQKVLLIDGSLHKSLLQSNTPMYQELIYSEIPTLHSTFLDLLSSTIIGMRSSLIPHAGIVVMLIAEYFKRAKLPALRRKLYTVVRLLLNSMGVGMVMQLLQVVISNIFADLNDNSGSSLFSSSDSIEATSSSREQTQQPQSSTVSNSEPTCNRQIMAPLCVKIGALETLEVLLNVGGSFRECPWRTEMDLLLIHVATNAYYKAGMYEQRPSRTENPSISDFQLASFKVLLASFLSNPDERPPFLEQGLELFNRGKLETGTELGNFCSHALLALDVLVHPRQLPPLYFSKRVARDDLEFRSGAPELSVLGSGISQSPCSMRKRGATDDLGGECKYQLVSIENEPTDALAKHSAVEKHAPVELSNYVSVHEDAQGSHAITGGDPEFAMYCLPTEGVQAIPVTQSIRTDIEMTDGSCSYHAGFDTLGDDPPDFFSVYPAPISITPLDSHDPGYKISNKESEFQGRVLSGDASSSQNVPAHTSTIPAAASAFGFDWDSLEPLLDIGDPDADLSFFPDVAGVNPESD